MEVLKESPTHHSIKRRAEEPKLQIGEKISLKGGGIGIVLARYTASGAQDETCYVVEVLPDEGEKSCAKISS